MAGLPSTQFNRLLAMIRGDDVFRVPLTNGGFALVDAADADLVRDHNWWQIRGYARTNVSGKHILMHRLILGEGRPKHFVDHEDGDGLNNRRYNLRWATSTENMRNRRANTRGTSRFKGVYLDGHSWRAAIVVRRKKLSLGAFTKERDAARAYDRAAREHFGEFAKTNEDLGLYDKAA